MSNSRIRNERAIACVQIMATSGEVEPQVMSQREEKANSQGVSGTY